MPILYSVEFQVTTDGLDLEQATSWQSSVLVPALRNEVAPPLGAGWQHIDPERVSLLVDLLGAYRDADPATWRFRLQMFTHYAIDPFRLTAGIHRAIYTALVNDGADMFLSTPVQITMV